MTQHRSQNQSYAGQAMRVRCRCDGSDLSDVQFMTARFQMSIPKLPKPASLCL